MKTAIETEGIYSGIYFRTLCRVASARLMKSVRCDAFFEGFLHWAAYWNVNVRSGRKKTAIKALRASWDMNASCVKDCRKEVLSFKLIITAQVLSFTLFPDEPDRFVPKQNVRFSRHETVQLGLLVLAKCIICLRETWHIFRGTRCGIILLLSWQWAHYQYAKHTDHMLRLAWLDFLYDACDMCEKRVHLSLGSHIADVQYE